MTIYVIQKVARHQLGEFCLGTVEAAFVSEVKAREYCRTLPTIWSETINNMVCDCERAVCIVELNNIV